MIIDFHTHIFPEKIAAKTISMLEEKAGIKSATNGTIDGLLASMDEADIDMSVILPVVTKPSQTANVNAFAASVNYHCRGRLLSFGGIHPDTDDYKRDLDHMKELGLIGVKIHPDYQRVFIDDVRFMNIIEYADALDMIIITHAGIDIGYPEPVHCPPDKMRKVLDALKPKKMVAAHYGGWKQWEEVYEYLAGAPIYLDTAFTSRYINKDMFYKILEKHDKDKILFATDSPWSSQSRDVELMKEMGLPKDVEAAIFGENAKKLLNL